jgi:hypothetical protein
MASSLIRNQVPRKGLRVRVPCPPLVFVREFAPSGPYVEGRFRLVAFWPAPPKPSSLLVALS